jgi:hypothetical protein
MSDRWTAGSRRRLLLGLAAALLLAGVGTGAAIAFSSSGGRYVPALRATVPADKLAQIQHAQPRTAPESTVPAPAPLAPIAPIPATLAPAGAAPIPVSPALVRVTSSYLVSNGRTLVAVYAGTAGDDARDGRFVIIRQNLSAGTQSQRVVSIAGAGALTIDGAPTGAAVETSAQTATLHFRSASGRTGVLSLATTRASLR